MIQRSDHLSLQYIARNLCIADRDEIFATRADADPDLLAAEALLAPHSYVCLRGDKGSVPVSAFGVVPAWPGVWNVWMFSAEQLDLRAGIEIVRHFRTVIVESLLKATCHRVQCDSMATHKKAHAFIQRFGGIAEARMAEYGKKGEDFIRFSWNRQALVEQQRKSANNSKKCDITGLREAGVQRNARVVDGNRVRC